MDPLDTLIALLPVALFLLMLRLLDSFQLIKLRLVVGLMVGGVLAALLSWFVNQQLVGALDVSDLTFRRYIAPPVEELLKGLIPIALIRRRSVGFLVDAAICGFAVGAGFAMFENLYYLWMVGEAQQSIWVVRGFGTALMHGAVTATLALRIKHLWDLKGPRFSNVLRGLLLATVVHSLFNHFFLRPDLSTLALLLVLPAYFWWVFRASESSTRKWLRSGFDSDAELLLEMNAGALGGSSIGRYIDRIKSSFPPESVIDMICLIRIRLELSIRAKGLLMMKEAGFDPEPDPAALAQLEELEHLEESLGATGRRALAPLFNDGERELWELGMLRKSSA